MPAVSTKQRELMAKNRGVLKMSHKQLHDFAATKGLRTAMKRRKQ